MSPRGRKSAYRAATPKNEQPSEPRRLFVVRPSKRPPAVRAVLREFEYEARKQGLITTVYPSTRVSFDGESPKSGGDVLAPNDAAALYREAHRALTLVVAADAVHVALDPSREAPTRRHTIPLERFVAHKALFRSLSPHQDVRAPLRAFSDWPEGPGCVGESDPRVLPLHVFETREDWTGLPDGELAKKFARLYGAGGMRRDHGRKIWARTHEYHGGPSLQIGGTALAAGMHWDVRAERRGTLVTSNSVWHLSGARGYVNVFPDASTNLAPGRSTAIQVWPLRSGQKGKYPR